MATIAIKTREELFYCLTVVCELEQGLCLQYLFSAFSLKDSLSEGGINTHEQLNYVRKWKASMFHVAAQEMLHLTQAANLCTAVGGVVRLARPNFPQRVRYYPTHLPWRLDPFAFDTVRRYAYYERPANWQAPLDPLTGRPMSLDDTVSEKDKREVDEHDFLSFLEKKKDIDKTGLEWKVRASSAESIGDLYATIKRGFFGVPNVIIGDPEAQVEPFYVDFPDLLMVFTPVDAARAIDVILHQGEGTIGDSKNSHYGVFMGIYNEYVALKRVDPTFEPARKVASNPLSRVHVDNGCWGFRVIDDSYTRDVNDLCSDVYMTMLLLLQRFFVTSSETREELITMSRAFLRIMTGVIKALGETLTRLPMGAETPGLNAGPSFEINRDIQLLPYQRSAWIYVQERLEQHSMRARALSTDERAPQDIEIREALEHAGVSLSQIAADFAKSSRRP